MNRQGTPTKRRARKPYWSESWLRWEYLIRGRSACDIATECGGTEGNVLYFIRKFNIPTRSTSEVRAIHRWGAIGEANPMYGRTGELNPNWKGGVSPERAAFYSSAEWKAAAQKVWRRDRGTCQRCGTIHGEMHIHHIVSFAVVELRAELSNLILLCNDCHDWVHSRENTEGEYVEVR